MKNRFPIFLGEADFKRWFRSKLIWSEAIEPGLGAGTGAPDLLTIIDGQTVLIELKVGMWRERRLYCREIRPAQISWHRRFRKAGGISFTAIGVVGEDGWEAWCVEDISDWKRGWPAREAMKWPNVKSLIKNK